MTSVANTDERAEGHVQACVRGRAARVDVRQRVVESERSGEFPGVDNTSGDMKGLG